MLTREQALRNKATFDSLAAEYRRNDTRFATEFKLRELLPLSELDMLDLGVGGGRTTAIFASLVKSYIGVDYSSAMVEACRSRFPDHHFSCEDARALGFVSKAFDFVLFSFNGIDYVEPEGRQQILNEVWRVLRPAGHFCFASHLLRRSYRSAPGDCLYLNDGAHGGRLLTFYGTMNYQLREIAEHGFEIQQVMGLDGRQIEQQDATVEDYCLHYLCRKPSC